MRLTIQDKSTIILGSVDHAIKTIPDESIDCCVTSPPYWNLRDYGEVEQIGLEQTPEEYIKKLVYAFGEVKRVLKKEGTLWINIGDTYATQSGTMGGDPKYFNLSNREGLRDTLNIKQPKPESYGLKHKDLVGIPWMLAFALRDSGFYLRNDIIWDKPNPMVESVRDRCTKSHEYIFLLTKSPKYYYEWERIAENCIYSKDKKNRRTVWRIKSKALKEEHYAPFPEKIAEQCILAGCPERGTVLDPFCGAGTTGIVAIANNRKFIGIDISKKFVKLTHRRIKRICDKPFSYL